MKLLLPFIGTAFSATIPLGFAPPQPINGFVQPQPMTILPQQPVQILQQPANPFGTMDPMMLMMLLNDDDDSSFKDILPLMMMQGGNFDQNSMMPLMMMLGDDDDSSLSELLPLMMMQGGNFGGQNGMNPLLMMTLLDDDECEVNDNVELFTDLSETEKKQVARGDYVYYGTTPGAESDFTGSFLPVADLGSAVFTSAHLAEINKYIDYKFINCESQSSSSFKDLLPLMMMGQQNMQTMDPMMLMMLVDDDSNDLSLPMLMSMQGMNTGSTPNPLLWLTLLDDSTLSKKQCDAKYELDYIFEWSQITPDTDTFLLTKTTTDIRDVVLDVEEVFTHTTTVTQDAYENADEFLTNYYTCVDDATSEGSDSALKDILPLMMMNGGGFGGTNGQINPMMLALLSDSDSDSNLLPLMMMQNGQQMDPMMMMLMLKD
jgi:hypothetical protein